MTSSCSGEGFQGAWGLGRWEKVEKCFIFGPFVFDIFSIFQHKMKKFDEIGQIRSDWAHIENPDSGHRVLDSPGGFGKFFRKIGEKLKFEFSGGNKKIF